MNRFQLAVVASLAFVAAPAGADTPPDPWQPLAILEGNWSAATTGGKAGAKVLGTYTFARELGGHVLARHGKNAGCKGPKAFDCEHTDLLYVFEDLPAQPLKAIYMDSEGHVIHYAVTATPTTVTFLSEPGPGPAFRLVYERTGTTMSGKFQAQPPGSPDWTSYLEWTGTKQP